MSSQGRRLHGWYRASVTPSDAFLLFVLLTWKPCLVPADTWSGPVPEVVTEKLTPSRNLRVKSNGPLPRGHALC